MKRKIKKRLRLGVVEFLLVLSIQLFVGKDGLRQSISYVNMNCIHIEIESAPL